MRKLNKNEVCVQSIDWDGIIIMNGIELKSCLSLKRKSLVYIWQPNCHGKFCYSLKMIQDFCNQKNYDFFVVAEYYDLTAMKTQTSLTNSIIGIDTKYYKTNLTNKYLRKFLTDLTNSSDVYNNFFLFEKGIYMKSLNTMDEVENFGFNI